MITDYVELPVALQPHADDGAARSASRDCERCSSLAARIADLEGRLAHAERILLLTDTRNQLRARSARQRPAPGLNTTGR